MKTRFISILSLSILLLTSCYYDNGEDLYGQLVPCDTANVKYSVQVINILSQNCYRCHGGNAVDGAGVKLQDFQVLQRNALNGTLLGVLKHAPGYVQMPKNATKLSNCDIAVIEAWIRKGALEN
jgi:cytochrome c553